MSMHQTFSGPYILHETTNDQPSTNHVLKPMEKFNPTFNFILHVFLQSPRHKPSAMFLLKTFLPKDPVCQSLKTLANKKFMVKRGERPFDLKFEIGLPLKNAVRKRKRERNPVSPGERHKFSERTSGNALAAEGDLYKRKHSK